jgi:glycosyltransferase involved in cell wall biosynthesis
MTAVSVIVAVYNAQAWLPRFITSLQAQTLKDFEAIFLDDASTDASAALIQGRASADPRLKLVRLPENRGAGTARNQGIRSAAGETICFADPDDLLPENSLEVRYAAYKKHNAVVRACHDEIADDGRLLHRETRPADLPEICAPADIAPRFGVNPFLCAHWTWLLPTGLLLRHNIFHGENMRTADDIVMLARLFFHISRLVWIPDTVYYWIKRADSLSTTRYTPEHYADYFHCCDLFYEEAEKRRQVSLADMFCDGYCSAYLAHLTGQLAAGKSTEDDARGVMRAAARVCGRHKVFERLQAGEGRLPPQYLGLHRLWLMVNDKAPSMTARLVSSHNRALRMREELAYADLRKSGWGREVDFDKFDAERGLLRARYLFCDVHPGERVTHDGRDMDAAFSKNRLVHKGEDYVIFERILWLPVPQRDECALKLTIAGKDTGLDHTATQVRRMFAPKPPDDRNFPPDVRALRRLAQSKAMRERFKNAWMFMDRDTRADDNAEHLYRWVMRYRPEINAWFVLRTESVDWKRLEAEGFRLIAFDSIEHKVLFLLAENLISSQMDVYVYAYLDDSHYGDIRRCKYVSLQHGVIKEDLSPWLNSVDMDCFVTTTPGEWHSIIDDGAEYVLTEKETARTGLPRYDSLLAAPPPEKRVFVMPTWRADLVGQWDGKGQRRDYNPAFSASVFARAWRALLCSPDLSALCATHGCEIVFWPHPGFEDYLEDFNLPEHIRVPAGESIQTLLKSSALLVTDYSSIAFDMAFMLRPVLYYQFDMLSSFASGQNRRPGYFSYERDGFGPVCRNEGELLEKLDELLRAGCRPEETYLDRMRKTFDLRDGKCCERAFEAVLKLRERWTP